MELDQVGTALRSDRSCEEEAKGEHCDERNRFSSQWASHLILLRGVEVAEGEASIERSQNQRKTRDARSILHKSWPSETRAESKRAGRAAGVAQWALCPLGELPLEFRPPRR